MSDQSYKLGMVMCFAAFLKQMSCIVKKEFTQMNWTVILYVVLIIVSEYILLS